MGPRFYNQGTKHSLVCTKNDALKFLVKVDMSKREHSAAKDLNLYKGKHKILWPVSFFALNGLKEIFEILL